MGVKVRATWILPITHNTYKEIGILTYELIRISKKIKVEMCDMEGFVVEIEPLSDTLLLDEPASSLKKLGSRLTYVNVEVES